MACGYLNSAGTDLDSLFFVDNSNAGAIGFTTSVSQDLGNRFNAQVTLGTNIGYKNSAGTDIGYLRGKLVAPAGSASSSQSSKTTGYRSVSVSYDCNCGEYGCSTCSRNEYYGYGKAVFATTVSISNGMPADSITYTLQLRASETCNADITINTNSTTIPSSATGGAVDASPSLTTSFKDIHSWSSTSKSMNCGIYIEEYYCDTSKSRPTYYVRMKAVVTNRAGTVTWYTGEQSF